jgi:predicted MFS family arabinose efflux permease
VTTTHVPVSPAVPAGHRPAAALRRGVVVGLIAFLTLVDLFATQAILPSLAEAYGVGPAAMGLAVNVSTVGMAMAGLAVAFFSRRIDRRRGIVASLALLALPTALLAGAPDLATFAILRLAQGALMATAFALTLAYFAERCSAEAAAGALAAYVTGNVASNLLGRLLAAAAADHLGLAATFHVFALLNLAGAALAHSCLMRTPPMRAPEAPVARPLAVWREHLRNGRLRLAFAIGFLILFAFIGTFTFINFVLARAPLGLRPMALGLAYLVFLPSIVTTPLAGRAVGRFGTRPALWGALAAAGAGLPLLLLPSLTAVLVGLALVGVGTFFAQAVATGFVGRVATADRGAAGGLYLACYFLGGIVGTAALGQAYGRFGWPGCVAGIGLALGLAAWLAIGLKMPGAADRA